MWHPWLNINHRWMAISLYGLNFNIFNRISTYPIAPIRQFHILVPPIPTLICLYMVISLFCGVFTFDDYTTLCNDYLDQYIVGSKRACSVQNNSITLVRWQLQVYKTHYDCTFSLVVGWRVACGAVFLALLSNASVQTINRRRISHVPSSNLTPVWGHWPYSSLRTFAKLSSTCRNRLV